jgi:uncharacterized repeat protein (TIGR03803 family)
MKLKKTFSIITALLLSLAISTKADNYRVLHHFAGGANDGAIPYGSLICSGSTLYGMSFNGGSSDNGTIFRIDANGTGFQLLHSFVSAGTDGQNPIGSLLLSGSTLYGMATSPGSSYGGTIFKVNTDGNDFQVLRMLGTSDGMWPWGYLVQSGSMLYGLNTYGGNASGFDGKGTAFRINADGTGFEVLHTFTGGSNDGEGPHGSFLLIGSTLYAATPIGGSSGRGIIFKINTDGTGFQILHSFAGSPNDGDGPITTLTSVPPTSTLFGTTAWGGSGGYGTIFKINTDGTGYQILHNFAGGSNGQKPYGSLTLVGSTLFGVTSDQETATNGTIFKINADGSDFNILHRFNGTDGRCPYFVTLANSGLILYGMTGEGGNSGNGVIFAIDVPVTCVNPPAADLNGDCKVDFQDFAIMANQWLECGLEPLSACNQ